jgi:N6-L-threonylcarbamoyladenine synthase
VSRRAAYHVLAIETSCDDTTLALIDRPEHGSPRLITHVKRSLDNTKAGGIIPLDARNFHQQNLAPMVRELFAQYNVVPLRGLANSSSNDDNIKIDLICATRGPGMIGSLSAGYNFAKGLSVALNVPLVGVHHMVGHLLTPRFFQVPLAAAARDATSSAAATTTDSIPPTADIPDYPFFSLLVSGGHTMLVRSASPTDHTVLANTVDIAIGDMLDKCARELGLTGNMLGQELEKFINTTTPALNDASAAALASIRFPNPLQNKSGRAADRAAFSFAGFITALRTAVTNHFPGTAVALDLATRRALAERLQTAIFKHLVSKTALALRAYFDAHQAPDTPVDIVCAGGVASNLTLRAMLEEELRKPAPPSRKKKGSTAVASAGADFLKQPTFRFHYPAPKWCTDNALMIGWAGIELWETARLHTDLAALPTAKWPIEEVLAIDGWLPRAD